MAQWLGRRFPEPKTEGSNPSRDVFYFFPGKVHQDNLMNFLRLPITDLLFFPGKIKNILSAHDKRWIRPLLIVRGSDNHQRLTR